MTTAARDKGFLGYVVRVNISGRWEGKISNGEWADPTSRSWEFWFKTGPTIKLEYLMTKLEEGVKRFAGIK